MAALQGASQALPIAGRLDLHHLDANRRYECALAYDLPPGVTAWVEELRRELALPAPPEHQMFPHLTLLYVGRIEGHLLLELDALFQSVEFSRVRVRVGGGFSCFAGENRVINVHLPVSPAEGVRREHRRLLSAFRTTVWTPQTHYLEQDYIPHVTLFDRTDLDGWLAPILRRCREAAAEVDLARPVWIGRPWSAGITSQAMAAAKEEARA